MYNLLKSLGYDFDPGLPGGTGFWYDHNEWPNDVWPSVQMEKNGQDRPQNAYDLITVKGLLDRFLDKERESVSDQMVSIDQVIEYLNSLVVADKPAIGALLSNRVPCNQEMADHPTAIVHSQNGGWYIGLMGVINGMFGLDEGSGPIAYVFEDGNLVGFIRTIKET